MGEQSSTATILSDIVNTVRAAGSQAALNCHLYQLSGCEWSARERGRVHMHAMMVVRGVHLAFNLHFDLQLNDCAIVWPHNLIETVTDSRHTSGEKNATTSKFPHMLLKIRTSAVRLWSHEALSMEKQANICQISNTQRRKVNFIVSSRAPHKPRKVGRGLGVFNRTELHTVCSHRIS